MFEMKVGTGSDVVIISANDFHGPFETRLYVNGGETPTQIVKRAKTINGARKQAYGILDERRHKALWAELVSTYADVIRDAELADRSGNRYAVEALVPRMLRLRSDIVRAKFDEAEVKRFAMGLALVRGTKEQAA